MFRKILIAAMFCCAAGYCFAATETAMPQIVTSEVFYVQDKTVDENQYVEAAVDEDYTHVAAPIPAWPIAGTDADVEVGCDDGICSKNKQSDNIRIVSKIGSDLVVENNFNMGVSGDFTGWSGGANMLHGNQIPVGFDDECDNGSEMPLLHREVLEDDGGDVLTLSRTGRKNCAQYADGYTAYLAKIGLSKEEIAAYTAEERQGVEAGLNGFGGSVIEGDLESEFGVNISADAEAPAVMIDQVRSWVVASGQTLREVLQSWCDKEGWDLVWTTTREYPIEASAVFKGRFVDVASALVRNFERATPIPYAKFYKGNRVLVVSTAEE